MASVIKSNAVRSRLGATGLLGFNLSDLANEGRRTLESAEDQAAEILAEAHRQAEAIRRKAHEQGHREGLEQAEQEIQKRSDREARRRIDRELPVLRRTTSQLADTQAKWLAGWNDTLVGLALEVARCVVDRELATDPEIVARWASQAVAQARAARRLTLAVHPETLARIGDQLDQVLRAPGLPEQSAIEPDESVEPAGVVLRQDGGEIDLQLATQLDQLREQLDDQP